MPYRRKRSTITSSPMVAMEDMDLITSSPMVDMEDMDSNSSDFIEVGSIDMVLPDGAKGFLVLLVLL